MYYKNYEEVKADFSKSNRTEDLRIYAYLTDPAQLTELQSVSGYDDSARRTIEELQNALQIFKDYRKDLCRRYAELDTMTYKEKLLIERERRFSTKKVKYNVSIVRTYSDGTTTTSLYETFPGTERKQAFERFEEIRKSRPGIECEKRLEKAYWEK